MATREQFEFYKSLYKEEDHRSQELDSRAKFYFTVISAFLGALLLKATEFHTLVRAFGIPKSILILETVLLLAALAFVVISMSIRRHQSIANGADIFHRDVVLADKDFYDDQIINYNHATQCYRKKNDQAAGNLVWGAGFLTTAMILLLAALALGPYFTGM